MVRVDNTQNSQGLWKLLQTLVDLLIEQSGGPLPLTHEQEQVAAAQLYPHIRSTLSAASLCPGRQAVASQLLG